MEMPSEVPSENSADDRMLVGACQCGAVRYRVADETLYAANCHCSRCRAATGSAFKAFAGLERKKLEITEGMDTLLVFGEVDLSRALGAARIGVSEGSAVVNGLDVGAVGVEDEGT